MKKRTFTVELDDATALAIEKLGDPVVVLQSLAAATADTARYPAQEQRERTDESLKTERDAADDAASESARRRDNEVISIAGVALAAARAVLAANERKATDEDLGDERAWADTVLVDQREANGHLVRASLRATDLADYATRALARAEESERELRKVADFRELFIGILGHDLRNPLGSITTATALLLRRGHLNDQDAETAARIIRGTQRMTRMITQLLDLTRTRLGGGFPLELEPTDLGAVCRDVAEEFEAPIEVELAGDVTGTWDRDRLEEVLSNLIGNAIGYALAGTHVKVRARGEGAEVVVEISNQGDPIPDDVLPFIFEPFHRAKPEKSAAGNLGLGLYIAKQILLAHGGTLDASSSGGTTTFTMRLPREVPPAKT